MMSTLRRMCECTASGRAGPRQPADVEVGRVPHPTVGNVRVASKALMFWRCQASGRDPETAQIARRASRLSIDERGCAHAVGDARRARIVRGDAAFALARGLRCGNDRSLRAGQLRARVHRTPALAHRPRQDRGVAPAPAQRMRACRRRLAAGRRLRKAHVGGDRRDDDRRLSAGPRGGREVLAQRVEAELEQCRADPRRARIRAQGARRGAHATARRVRRFARVEGERLHGAARDARSTSARRSTKTTSASASCRTRSRATCRRR